jgi:AcrR family transcriptional regulator
MSPYRERENCLRLVEALIDVVADVEPARVTTGDVETRAVLAPGAVERCWGSIDELVGAAYSRAARLLHDTMAAALGSAGPWRPRWEAAVRASLALMGRRPGIARLLFIESEGPLPAIRERRELHRREFVELFAIQYARDGQSGDVPALHVELAAGAAYRAFHEEAMAGRLTAGCGEAVPRLIDAMAIFQPVAA